MVEEIANGLFRIEIPLPKNPLKIINDYLIITPERNLLIDTGLNLSECKEALDQGLAQLGVDLYCTDLFITHMHADHSGLITHVARPGSRVFCSVADATWLSQPYQWTERLRYAQLNGFPDWKDARAENPIFKFVATPLAAFTLVDEGDTIVLPGWHLQCVFTPGHSRGHMCLYEPDRKWLFSGDHVLEDITPTISLYSEEEWDPLRDYLHSLDKVAKMEVILTLPAHRRLITDLERRIAELRQHHQKRCNDILLALQDNRLTAYQVAARIKWDLSYDKWEDFPNAQKWFAQGEIIAHLKYLEGEGKVHKDYSCEEGIFYQLS